MRKITGKALATVLAMALITSSFSGTFAFAASRTEKAGSVSFDGDDEITLVKNDDTKVKYDLMDLIGQMRLDTVDKAETDLQVDPEDITVRHAKGDSLISISRGDDEHPLLRVKTDKTGTETLMVYGETTITRDDKDVTLKGQKEITVNVIEDGTIFIGDADANIEQKTGEKVPSLEMAYNEHVGKDDPMELAIYKAYSDKTNSVARFTAITKDDEDRALRIESNGSSKIEVVDKDEDGGVDAIYNVGKGTGTLKLNIKANTGTDFSKTETVDSTTATILKKLVLNGDVTYDKDGGDETITGANSIPNFTWGEDKVKDSNISGYDIDANGHTFKVSGSASVGKVTNAANLTVEDKAKVGDVEDVKEVVVGGGTVGNITEDDISDATVSMTDGRVESIDVSSNVSINGGAVTGNVTGGAIALNVEDDDINTTIGGSVKGTSITVNADSEDAALTAGKLIADGAADITLNGGSNVTISAIDGDYEGNVLFEDFQGTIESMVNVDAITATEDTNATVKGNVKATSLDIDENGAMTFTDAVEVDELGGDGKLTVGAGKLVVNEGLSGSIILRLAGNTVNVGDEAFRTGEDVTDTTGVQGLGFNLEKKTEGKQDVYLVKSTYFAGVALDKSEVTIAKGFSDTVTVSNYPASTSLPAGASVVWDYSDADKDVFEITADGATLTIKVKDYDSVYATSNSFDLYATVVDADGDALEDYDSAVCTVTAIPEVVVSSDLSGIVEVPQGSTKDFVVNSQVEAPVTIGTGNVAVHALKTPFANGQATYTIKATGAVGTTAGVYATVPGQNAVKLFIIKVTEPVVTSDTTVDFNLAAGNRYVFKITAPSAPSFTVGNGAVLKTQAGKIDGNDYYFAVYAIGSAGQSTGVYVNGVKVCTVTVG